jgi:hypothetical protein
MSEFKRKIPPKPHCIHQEDCPVVIEAVNAQLAQDKADRDKERRAIGEWLERTLIFLSSSNSPTGQKAVEALKRGELPEGIKEDG